VGWEGGVCM